MTGTMRSTGPLGQDELLKLDTYFRGQLSHRRPDLSDGQCALTQTPRS